MLLPYEKQIFANMMEHDALLIMARSLGVARILTSLLSPFCHPASLVLVINTTSHEEEYLINRLLKDDIEQAPRIINADIGREERVKVYLSGGVMFISSRILVVDLLTDKIPSNLITGIIVYNSHRIAENGLESFILRLFRQKNKEGFVKALSDNPISFTNGYCHVEKVMRSLFLNKLYLFPRFHADVVACMERHEPQVVELGVPVSEAMKGCQMALLDLINLCIKELKIGIPSLDLEEVTYENLITRAFDVTVRLQLDPVWNQLTQKSKQLVADLKTLRDILRYLTQYDCVTFFNMVRSLVASEKEFTKNVGWLSTDAADRLYIFSQQRVYGVSGSKKSVTKSKDASADEEKATVSMEENPKWKIVTEILTEIDELNNDPAVGKGRVLIAVDNEFTCTQLRAYLLKGASYLMSDLLSRLDTPSAKKQADGKAASDKKEEQKKDQPSAAATGRGTKRKAGKKVTREDKSVKEQLSTSKEEVVVSSDNEDAAADDSVCIADDYTTPYKPNQLTLIAAMRGSGDPNRMARLLEQLEPRYILLYDTDLSYIRQIEVYKACRPGVPLRVYVLMYSASSEEQRFLTSIRKEKVAFEGLIQQKASMVIPENRDGKLENDPSLSRGPSGGLTIANTRKGGVQSQATPTSQVLVDIREFRSELPFLVHKLGIDLVPLTLEVGDYILTPDICVERKSVSDLIGSLNNGRLYTQCTQMTRYYKRAVLLIEFDPTKAFTLQKNFSVHQEISINDIQSRLALLTLHFPSLRILWCQSAHATAQIFRELKAQAAEPQPEQALTVTSDLASQRDIKYNPAPYDLLIKVPNITLKNIQRLLDASENARELSRMSSEELCEVLGSKQIGEQVYEFLHKDMETMKTKGENEPSKSNKQPAKKARLKRAVSKKSAADKKGNQSKPAKKS